MKTTIDIAGPLLLRAKKLARRRNTTLKAIIEAALRDALDSESKQEKPFELRTHTFAGQGLQSGLSWDNWADIRSMAYEGRGG